MALNQQEWSFNPPVRMVQEVRRRGVATRAELAHATGVKVEKQVDLVRGLVEHGILSQDGPQIPTVVAWRSTCRKSTPLQLAGDLGTIVGIDVALDRITVGVSDAAYELLNAPDATAAAVDITDAHRTVEAIADLVVAALEDEHAIPDRIIGIGIGLPGPVDRLTGAPASDSILPGWGGLAVR